MKVSPRGLLTEEVQGVCIRFTPEEDITRSGFNSRLAEVFATQVLGRRYDLNELLSVAPKVNRSLFIEVPCNYGIRMGDQLETAVTRLLEDRDTRRAIVVLARPDDNPPPCILSIQFLIRESRLLTVAFMRSWDQYLGLPYDVYLFRALGIYMSQKTKCEVGDVIVLSSNIHHYL